ncbi:MAG: choice-of-anchor D domain-containing protein [Candidatus Kapabacteria bacterium]|nr:choice-of-anchor D domain-containing protein [Ignavibacteriota bacterium]MCW5885100.1 choice-of-anchor D domain-containing protein [Candidatus Kapabacteria bacterium]
MRLYLHILIYLSIFVPLSAQTFDIFDIDASEFPIMKAKFLAFDEHGNQITNVTTDDISIIEEGNVRRIISLTCNSNITLEPVSTVLVMDASGSMARRNLFLAQSAARAWINAMPDGDSECAITAFDLENYLIQDFTNIKEILLDKVNDLFAQGGTSYNAAFIDELYGGLIVSRNAQYKKVIVMMTDGRPTTATLEHLIIDEAIQQEAMIFVVTLGMPCPPVLRQIANVTGGQWFENVSTAQSASETYNQILKIVSGAEACEIVWESDVTCFGGERLAEINFYPTLMNKYFNYNMPLNSVTGINISPESVFFKNVMPGTARDTTIFITANNGDLNVSEIKFDHPAFEVFPRSFKINKGQTQPVKITYTAQPGGEYTWTRMEMYNNLCPAQIFASGGFAGKRPEKKTLKLTHPNGNELFVAGNDTVVTWEGIPETDDVRLEYSYDNGNNWNLVSERTNGGTFNWNRIPRTPSKECLMKVSQLKMDIGNNAEWARTLGGDFYFNLDEPHSGIALDIYGNIYVTGQFTETINVEGKILTSEGKEDIFIAKFSPDGELEWLTKLGGPESDVANEIEVDFFGNSYVVGKFSQSLFYDSRVLLSRGGTDAFIAKILPDGSFEWVKNVGGPGDDAANDIVIDNLGNVIITGAYSEGAYFGSFEIFSSGSTDIFLTKFSPEGNCLWVKKFGGEYQDEGLSLAVDLGNKIYLTGRFSRSARFENVNLVTPGKDTEFTDYDVFICKFFQNGTMEWVTQAGGERDDTGFGIGVDSRGDVFIAGSYMKEANFGGFTLQANSASENETSDIFIAKLNTNGRFDWVRTAGGNSNDAAYDLAVDSDGNAIITGAFTNRATFDNNEVISKGFLDVFVAKYTSQGLVEWVKRAGGSYADYGFSIALDAWGNSYIGGNYTNAGDFGSTILRTRLGLLDFYIWGAGGGNDALQEDVSDLLWTIAAPEARAIDVDMGQVYLGNSKDSVVVGFIKNVGNFDFRIDSIFFQGPEKDAFTIVSRNSNILIKTDSADETEFYFNPVKAGKNNSDIIIHTQSDTIRRKITGEGLLPDLMLIHRNIDFGKVLVGENKDTLRTAMIANNSKNPIEITETRHNKPNDVDFKTIEGGGNQVLMPGDTLFMDLRFEPSEKGRTSGSLEFHHKGVGSPVVVILGGEGINPNPSILVSDNFFPELFCQSEHKAQLRISNRGGAILNVESIHFEGVNSSDFEILSELPLSVNPDRTSAVDVQYSSDLPGIKTAEIVIKSNSNPDSIARVPISVIMNGAKAISESGNIDFGILDLNENATKILTIKNAGNKAANFFINSISPFYLTSETVFLLPNQSAEIEVKFDGINESASLSGKITILDEVCNFETAVDIRAIVNKKEKPIISVLSQNFEVLNCESSINRNFTISNQGRETLNIESIDILNDIDSEFVITPLQNNSIPQGESAEFELSFIPKSAGDKSCQLFIKSNSEIDSELSIPVEASYHPVSFEISENTLDVGRIIQSQTAEFKVNLTNSGFTTNTFTIINNNDIEFTENRISLNSGETRAISGNIKTDDLSGINIFTFQIVDSICKLMSEVRISASIYPAAAINLKVLSSEGFAGDVIEIPVIATEASDLTGFVINSFDFHLKFNPTILLPVNTNDYEIIDGIGSLTLKDVPYNGEGELLRIPFKVGLGDAEISNLIISNPNVNGDDVAVMPESGIFTSLGICFEGGARLINPNGQGGIMKINPNPAHSEMISISVNIIENGIHSVSIYNSNGYLKEDFLLKSEKGSRQLFINSNDLESGVYFIQYTSPTINEVKKLVIIK